MSTKDKVLHRRCPKCGSRDTSIKRYPGGNYNLVAYNKCNKCKHEWKSR